MNYSHGWIFWLIPVYAAAVAASYYIIRRPAVSLATLPFVASPKTWRTTAVQLGILVLSLGLISLLAALSKPWESDVHKLVLPSGIEVMVALDVSGSMAGEDFRPKNRLEVAKEVLRNFIQSRPSDRIGLILFSGQSVTRSPLTLRHEPLLQTLEHVEMGKLPEGTAIGLAILSGINRLTTQNAQGGDRILVLITDGRNNAGEVHPYDALTIAVQNKIRIYTIGVGSYGDVPYPVITPDGKKTYRYEKADLDETLLEKVAASTGGKYFRATDPKSLELLFEQINKLEKSEPQTIETRMIRSRSKLFVYPALILLFAYFGLQLLIRRMP